MRELEACAGLKRYKLPQLKARMLSKGFDAFVNYRKIRCVYSEYVVGKPVKKEDEMEDYYILKFIMMDILTTQEYSMEGVASDINEPEDVLFELMSGVNKKPSHSLGMKLMELHSTLRPELYG